MSAAAARGRLIYVGDPMCSWCYGFAPELARLLEHAGDAFEPVLVLGGLRPFTTETMGDRLRGFLEHHWDEVAKRSGQPFDKSLLARTDFVYDTEPACRAVVAARSIAPARTFDFFAAVQRAFYAEGRDTNEPATYLDVCAGLGLDADAFGAAFESDEIRRLTQEDFELSRDMGVQGFPTLLAERDDRLALLTTGYTGAAELIDRLDEFAGAPAA